MFGQLEPNPFCLEPDKFVLLKAILSGGKFQRMTARLGASSAVHAF